MKSFLSFLHSSGDTLRQVSSEAFVSPETAGCGFINSFVMILAETSRGARRGRALERVEPAILGLGGSEAAAR